MSILHPRGVWSCSHFGRSRNEELTRKKLILHSRHSHGQGDLHKKHSGLGFKMERREAVKCIIESRLEWGKAELCLSAGHVEFIYGQEGARSATSLDHGLHEKWWQRFVGCFVLAGSDRKSFQTHHGSQDLPVRQEVTLGGYRRLSFRVESEKCGLIAWKTQG